MNIIFLCFLILSVGCFINSLKFNINQSVAKKISLSSSLKGFGYWLNGRDMKDVNLSDLSKKEQQIYF